MKPVGLKRLQHPEGDYYPTPAHATKAIMEREDFPGVVWEPACGEGYMSEVIKQYCPTVEASDLIYREYGFRHDFLNDPPAVQCDNIITNPPFKLALEFVLKAKNIARKKIAMLLRIQFLEGQARYHLFQDTTFRLKEVHIFSRRLTMAPGKLSPTANGQMCFAWFVWDRDYNGQPIISWII